MNKSAALHKLIDEYEAKSDFKKLFLQNQCIGNYSSEEKFFCVIAIPEKTIDALEKTQKMNSDWIPRLDYRINVNLYSYNPLDENHNEFDHWGECADVTNIFRIDDGFTFRFENDYEFTLDDTCNIEERDDFHHTIGYDGRSIVINISNEDDESFKFYYNVNNMLNAAVAETPQRTKAPKK